MRGAEGSLENFLTLIADQGTASFKILDCGEKIIEMTKGQRALRLIEKNEGFAEQGQNDVDLDHRLNIGVVEAALDRRCGGGDDDHESGGGGALACHGPGSGLVALARQHLLVSKVVDLPNRGVPAQMLAQDCCSLSVLCCKLGERLLWRGDQRRERLVEVGKGRISRRFDETVSYEDT